MSRLGQGAASLELAVAVGRVLGVADYVYDGEYGHPAEEALAHLLPALRRLAGVFQPDQPQPGDRRGGQGSTAAP